MGFSIVKWQDSLAELYEGPRMTGRLWVVTPGVVATRVAGHVDAGCVRWYTSRVDRLLLDGRVLQTFHDWEGIDSFDPDVRKPYRAWAERRVNLVKPPHFLVRSRILSMAVTATALILQHGLVAHTERRHFEAALDAAIDRDPSKNTVP
jgi:hypothetical protein